VVLLLCLLSVFSTTAAQGALPSASAPSAAGPAQTGSSPKVSQTKPKASGGCALNLGLANGVCGAITGGVSTVAGGVAAGASAVAGGVASGVSTVVNAPGRAVDAVGQSIFDQLTQWVASGAGAAVGLVVKGMQATTTPELKASWYQQRFTSMAALGVGLALLVAMIALGSAAVRRDPDALASTFVGMWRAGLGTGLVIALTVIALGVADGISSDVTKTAFGDGTSFFKAVSGVFSDRSASAAFGAAVGSTIVTLIFAIMVLLASIAVWIELILRNAVIYVAVLFLPITLAASVWPALRSWSTNLTKTLGAFVILKPVVVIILSLAGAAATAGLGGQSKGPVGVVLAAVVIFGLAAFSPFALLSLIGAGSEAHALAGHARGAVAGGLTGGSGGASINGSARSVGRGASRARQASPRAGGGANPAGSSQSKAASASGAAGAGKAGAGAKGPAAGGVSGAASTASATSAAGGGGAGAGGAGAGGAAGGAAAGGAVAGVGAVAAAAGYGQQKAKQSGQAADQRIGATASPAGGSSPASTSSSSARQLGPAGQPPDHSAPTARSPASGGRPPSGERPPGGSSASRPPAGGPSGD